MYRLSSWLAPLEEEKAMLAAAFGFPLAGKVRNRTALLRGYGNAIVPQVAAAFITSVMEELGITPAFRSVSC